MSAERSENHPLPAEEVNSPLGQNEIMKSPEYRKGFNTGISLGMRISFKHLMSKASEIKEGCNNQEISELLGKLIRSLAMTTTVAIGEHTLSDEGESEEDSLL